MAKITQSFQTEINQLLDLMIHSLYSHKEVFIRELISNASDAIDKLKYESLTKENLISDNTEFNIQIEVDSDKRILKVIDNGIGMTLDEVVKNLGTIAHSGTKEFLKLAQEAKSRPELIGQFGVGFYSSFMVADKVTVHTQKAGTSDGVLWESDGKGSFTVDSVPRPNGQGTTVSLHLKPIEKNEDTDHSHDKDYADEFTLKSLIKKYSDFISYPIKLKDEALNSQKALWLRSPSEIKEEEYKEFYHHISHDWVDPLKTIHYKAEGTMEFSSLMFIPSQKPWNYHFKDFDYGIELYVKRVFITADSKDFLPPYLRFVRGMVDSSDLSLNVSREMLQQDRQVQQIRKSLTNKILNTLKDLLSQNRESYEKFWDHFGPSLKEGVPTDTSNKEKLQDLLLFHSTHSDKMTTLEEYVNRMKPSQKHIYFITGENLHQIKNSPYLEKLKSKEYEVLLLVDPVDEWLTEALKDYKTKPLQSITKEDLDIDTEEEKKSKEIEKKNLEEKFKSLIENIKKHLGNEVKDVKISDRLTDSPACLVSGKYDPSAHMQRILSQFSQGESAPQTKRILEINPTHKVIERMNLLDVSQQEKWADIIYYQALMNEGAPLPDPSKFSKYISELMVGN